MPPLPSPGKVIRVTWTFTDGSDTDVLNRQYYSYSGSVSATDATAVATTLGNGWLGAMAPLVTTNFILQDITVTDLATATGTEVNTPMSHAGTNVGTKLPSSTCFVVSGLIARRYRGGHPRYYITGFPESDLANSNTWASASQTAILSAWQSTVTDLVTGPPADMGIVGPVNVGYYSGFTSIQNPITKRYRNVPTLLTTPHVDPITSWRANPKVASQRRRNKQSA
jgi:hypothetical protein